MGDNEEMARIVARKVRDLVRELQVMGRTDLLLQAITVPTLEQLRTEAARGSLGRLVVKRDGDCSLTMSMVEWRKSSFPLSTVPFTFCS